MKPLRITVVRSTTRPEFLSIRVDPNDPTATAFYRALTASGAQPGDVLEVRKVAAGTTRKKERGRAMTAMEALRKARVAMACGSTPGHLSGCPALIAHATGEDPFETFDVEWHNDLASCFLDGFAVRQVTAAEHTTEQPHG